MEAPRAASQIIAASGSVSPVTAGQIAWAVNQGFELIVLEAAMAVDEGGWCAEIARAVKVARDALSRGRSVLLASAQGPDDPSVARFQTAIVAAGADREVVNARIGEGLGSAILDLVRATGLRRVAFAGGDSSGYGARRLGIKALTALAPIAAGAPLCRAYSETPAIDGLEIVLKGGQMGASDFFGCVRAGGAIDGEEKQN